MPESTRRLLVVVALNADPLMAAGPLWAALELDSYFNDLRRLSKQTRDILPAGPHYTQLDCPLDDPSR
jgi:hypothetical protein